MPIIEKILAADPPKTVGTIGQALGPANTNANLQTVLDFVTSFINIALDTAGILAVIIILLAAFSYATSWGDDAQAEKAKKTITWSVIGLIIIGLAYGILGFVNDWLLLPSEKRDANPTAAPTSMIDTYHQPITDKITINL